jgi:hypothetical protein
MPPTVVMPAKALRKANYSRDVSNRVKVKSMESNSKDARNCREFINSSKASEIKILYAFKHYQSTKMRHSYSLKAKISENVGIFVLALKRKKCVFSLCSHASETFQTAKKKRAK